MYLINVLDDGHENKDVLCDTVLPYDNIRLLKGFNKLTQKMYEKRRQKYLTL